MKRKYPDDPKKEVLEAVQSRDVYALNEVL